jgi:DNA-binding PadR family transcriptional regulator
VTRIFGRGQLKLALLQVAAELGPANGYALMHALADRIGGGWQPSPGAIYPAPLALEDAGLLRGHDADGARHYAVTDAGRRTLVADPGVIEAVSDRAREVPAPPATVGSVLDRLASAAPRRDRPIGSAEVERLEALFRPVLDAIPHLTAEETP